MVTRNRPLLSIFDEHFKERSNGRSDAVRRPHPGYPLHFRKVLVSESRVDLLVNDTVVVELKAGERIAPAHEKQLSSYLQVSRKPVGLLFNFGLKTEMRRLVYTRRGFKLTDQ